MIRRKAWAAAPQALGVGGSLISALSDIGAGLTEAGWDDITRQRAEEETVRGMRMGREAVAGDQPLELRGDGTVAGQAFDQAATKSAAMAWGNKVRATLDQAAMQHQGDPASFEAALDGLRGAAEAQPGMVRELALADLDEQAARYRGLVQRQAVAKEREAQASEGLQLADRLSREATAAARAGNAAAAAKAAGDHQALWRTLRTDGVVSPQQEASALARLRGELDEQATFGGYEQAVGAGLERGQAFAAGWRAPAGMAPDQADALRRRMLADLDTRQMVAEREQRERERQQEIARRALAGEVRAAEVTLAATGGFAGFDELLRRAKAIDPEQAARLTEAKDGAKWTGGLMAMAPADAAEEVARMRDKARAATDPHVGETLARMADRGEHVAAEARKAIERDPLGWAEAHGVVTPTPLDRPDAYQRRVVAAQAVRERYGGGAVGVWRPHEAEAVAEKFRNATTVDERLDVLTSAIAFWPDDASRRTALAQLVAAKVPDDVAYVYRAALDPRRRAVARQLLGELTMLGGKKADKPELTGEADADRDAAVADAQEVYADNIGAVRRRQYALTGEGGYMAVYERDLAVTQRVAKVRAAGGLRRPGDSAYADLFGDLAVIDDEDLAHVVYPAGMGEAKVVARGLERLRETAGDMLAASLPAPKDPADKRIIDTALINETLRHGVWINSGDAFVLLVPGTGRALVRPDGAVWAVTPEQAARVGAAG